MVTRKPSPATMPRTPALGRSAPGSIVTGGIGGSRYVAQNVTVNSTASTAKATITPAPVDQAPKIRPAASGPSTPPAVVVV